MNIKCFECDKPAKHNHHVVPVVLGGTRTIPLCTRCHGLVHNKDFTKAARLQRIGIDKAKERGVYKGRRKGAVSIDRDIVMYQVECGRGNKEIADILGCSTKTIQRIKKENPATN